MSTATHTDNFGAPLEAGMKVAYFRGGRYDSLNLGTIKSFTPKMVRVEVLSSSRSGSFGNKTGETVLVGTDRIVAPGSLLPVTEAGN